MATPGAIQPAQRLRVLRDQADLIQNELATIFAAGGRQVSAAWDRPKSRC